MNNQGFNTIGPSQPNTPVNSFNTPQSGLNSPVLNGTSESNQQNNSTVSGMSFNSNGGVTEIKVTESNGDLCPFCGFKVNKSNNMCMHCGRVLGNALNQKSVLSVDQIAPSNRIEYEDVKNNNPKPIYIVTIIVFVLALIGTFFGSSLISSDIISSSLLLVIAIPSLIFSLFYLLTEQLLLLKAGLPWWGVYIPVYNIFLFSKLMTNRYLYILKPLYAVIALVILNIFLAQSIMLYFYCVAGLSLLLLWIVMVAKMSERFNVKFILLLLFPFIMLPIMAFSKRIVCF